MDAKISELPGKGRTLDELKRITRILDLLLMIDGSPRRYLRKDLAGHFEISERMIQKDLTVIRHGLKFPLNRTPEGYYFDALPKLPAVGFTVPEAAALVLSTMAAGGIPGVDEAALTGAFLKMEALFPEGFAALLRSGFNRRAPHAMAGRRNEILVLLNRALAEKRKVEIVYETLSRGREANRRIVRPYCVIPHVRSWHMVGHCELREEIRVFKIDRIRNIELSGEHFRIPDDFDPEDYLKECWGVMRLEGRNPEEVLLRFDPVAGKWVSEESWHPSQEVRSDPDGSVFFKVNVCVTPELMSWILYYGERVEVLAPASLRRQVAEAHRRAAGLYDSTEKDSE